LNRIPPPDPVEKGTIFAFRFQSFGKKFIIPVVDHMIFIGHIFHDPQLCRDILIHDAVAVQVVGGEVQKYRLHPA
jgi:hypothetical protein